MHMKCLDGIGRDSWDRGSTKELARKISPQWGDLTVDLEYVILICVSRLGKVAVVIVYSCLSLCSCFICVYCRKTCL